MNTVTRKFEFDAAHRVLNHGSKCRFLHGHRYVAEISLTSQSLDSLGFVMDFAEVKNLIGGWIDQNWDHNTILHTDDPIASIMRAKHGIFERPPFTLPYNPSAENMALYLGKQCDALLENFGAEVIKVRLYETPNCFAEWHKMFG